MNFRNFRNFRNESNNNPLETNGENFPSFGEAMGSLEFGSMNMNMNMEELLKEGAGYLQKQGSLSLPQTLSQKTVDDVLKDVMKEYAVSKQDLGSSSNALQKEQTLREMTLEEFLAKAGVVREDTLFPLPVNQINGGVFASTGFMGQPSNQIRIQDSSSQLNVNGGQANRRQQQIFPAQLSVAQGTELHGIRTVGLGTKGLSKNTREISSVPPPPVPHVFNGGLRGRRRGGAAEKVAERRQKRMIKNRESAARSRARKQAYTTELEAEVAKLKEENQELQRKQAEIMELRKNLVAEMMDTQRRPKKRYLKRRLTASW